VLYYPILLTRPELVLPHAEKSAAAASVPRLLYRPLPVDFAIHAVPALSVLLDFLVFGTKFMRREVEVEASAYVFAFANWYACFLEWTASHNGDCEFPENL
jgi:hypothetical protein